MSIFYHEDPPKRYCSCRHLASALKEALLAKRHYFCGRLPENMKDDDSCNNDASDFDQEEEVFVSIVISKYIESKSRRKCISSVVPLLDSSASWALSPEEWNSIIASRRSLMLLQKEERKRSTHCCNNDEEESENEVFVSANNSMISWSSSNFEEFYSTRACFSRQPSPSRFDNNGASMIMGCDFVEFLNCEGWPFGLCRRALLVPPLPKSPSDSWTWKKG